MVDTDGNRRGNDIGFVPTTFPVHLVVNDDSMAKHIWYRCKCYDFGTRPAVPETVPDGTAVQNDRSKLRVANLSANSLL